MTSMTPRCIDFGCVERAPKVGSPMDQQTFQQAIGLLSGEHSLAILRSLRDRNWHLSSEVARTLDIHTTTASKFLQRFAELGLVERQAHDSRTFEYRLRSSHLRFDVDLSDDAGPLREVVDFYVVYFQSSSRKSGPSARPRSRRRWSTG